MVDQEAGSLPASTGDGSWAGPADPRALGTATRARLYHTVRTAHLERALELAPAPILYGNRRYDFSPALAERAGAVPAGALRAALLLGRSGVQDLEVNEPAAIETVARTAVSLAWLRLRHVLRGRRRPRVVTYAIGNSDPFVIPPGSRLRRRLKRRVEHVLARYVWWELDRIAYGTHAAVQTYADAFGRAPARQRSTLVPALPAPCPCVDPVADRPGRVVFLGAFDARKGLSLVLDAWPGVHAAVPGAELVVIGKGDLEPQARAAADRDSSLRLVVDPPRAQIHDELRAARVLVLPSQPMPRWREQVGLPIVEALAHGCTVVTTDQTGLAQWLRAHGHVVVPGTADSAQVVDAVAAALRQGRAPESVLADLPQVDGRLAADAWMFADGPGTR